MSKIKFFKISHVEQMENMIHKSKGEVLMSIENKLVDIKNDTAAHQIFLNEVLQKKPIELLISDADDYSDFACFMVGASYN